MTTSNHSCDCIGTDAEDVLCAAADAMDASVREMAAKEQDFYSYLVSRYGPSNID